MPQSRKGPHDTDQQTNDRRDCEGPEEQASEGRAGGFLAFPLVEGSHIATVLVEPLRHRSSLPAYSLPGKTLKPAPPPEKMAPVRLGIRRVPSANVAMTTIDCTPYSRYWSSVMPTGTVVRN